MAKKYIPRYVDLHTDYHYGDIVTHEAYDEILNLLVMQGDYTSKVLQTLFEETNEDEAYNIPSYDNKLVILNHTIEDKIQATRDELIDEIDKVHLELADALMELGSSVVTKFATKDELKAVSDANQTAHTAFDTRITRAEQLIDNMKASTSADIRNVVGGL